MLNFSLQQVKELSRDYNVIPVYAEVLADTETPLSIFLKLKEKGKVNILLESAEGGIKWGRYSFTVKSSSHHIRYRQGVCELFKDGRVSFVHTKDPLGVVREELKGFIPYNDPELPRFWGGLVGYVSYDVVKLYEPVKDLKPDPLSLYDMYLVRRSGGT